MIMHVELVIFLLEAVHRYYESQRRVLFTDKKLERVERAMKNRKKTRTTQRETTSMSSIALLYSRFMYCLLYSYLIHVQRLLEKPKKSFGSS